MSETAYCQDHLPEDVFGGGVGAEDWDGGTFRDCTANEYLECQVMRGQGSGIVTHSQKSNLCPFPGCMFYGKEMTGDHIHEEHKHTIIVAGVCVGCGTNVGRPQ